MIKRKFYKNKFVYAAFLLALILFMYVNNSSLFAKQDETKPLLLAHRGLGQTFSMENITNDTCSAQRIFEPEHPYLENTIPSMEAAFDAGADIVELDIHPTLDEQFAVFHDWTLDCRTDGVGVTREHAMDELRQLDLGYGYTADNGITFPFRGEGVGMMPSLDEVFDYFSDPSFLIHIKSDDPNEGELLAEFLRSVPEDRLRRVTVYGGDQPIAVLKKEIPELRVMSKATMKSCLVPYLASGWTGYVSSSCESTQLHIPETIAPWLWGWPDKFVNRMEKQDTRVIVVAGDGGWSEGFDSVEDLKRLPASYSGGIWTNRIDRIAPVFN
ncbi:glycerophosphodiester phosphodiesterase family protein [Halalkalibacter kiskunsagensis]|uniref:Glycerophosphodiester phosphodiesterase family protein n=1 Tax=Halalkalibacter kiskunsagensis TaxID=1548599 RepID=A0ABV6K990_9BACI